MKKIKNAVKTLDAADFFKKRDEVWDAYLNELERLIGPSTDLSLLQPYSVSHAFPADATKYPKFTNYLANRECNVVTDFSATSNNPILTGSLLTERYGAFLAALGQVVNQHTLTPAEESEIQDLSTKKEDARQKLIQFDERVDALWNKYKISQGIPSDDKEWIARQRWENYYEYAQDRHLLRDQLSGANTAVWLFWLRVTPPAEQALRAAMEYWLNSSYEESFPPATTYENEPNYEHWGTHKSQTLQLNYDDFFKNKAVRSITIDETTKQSNTRKDHWNADGGYSCGFVSVGGGGSGSSEETHIRENVEKIEISWQRLEEVPVYRAPWFQNGLFTTYGKNLKGFWGPGGQLSCYPTHIIISRGLKISLYLKNVAHDTFHKVVEGSAGISIGPYHIGGGGGSEESSDNYSEQNYGFLIEDDPATARVLAVRIERPNYKTLNPNDFGKLLKELKP